MMRIEGKEGKGGEEKKRRRGNERCERGIWEEVRGMRS